MSHLIYQSFDVTHSKQFAHKGFRLERLQIVDVFARTDEDDGRLCGCHCGQSSASLGVAIQLGYDHRTDVHLVFEGFRLSLASLSDGGV